MAFRNAVFRVSQLIADEIIGALIATASSGSRWVLDNFVYPLPPFQTRARMRGFTGRIEEQQPAQIAAMELHTLGDVTQVLGLELYSPTEKDAVTYGDNYGAAIIRLRRSPGGEFSVMSLEANDITIAAPESVENPGGAPGTIRLTTTPSGPILILDSLTPQFTFNNAPADFAEEVTIHGDTLLEALTVNALSDFLDDATFSAGIAGADLGTVQNDSGSHTTPAGAGAFRYPAGLAGTTFVAPLSGRVTITASAYVRAAVAGNLIGFCPEVRVGAVIGAGALQQVASVMDMVANSNTQSIRAPSIREISGLTPGVTYNTYFGVWSDAINGIVNNTRIRVTNRP